MPASARGKSWDVIGPDVVVIALHLFPVRRLVVHMIPESVRRVRIVDDSHRRLAGRVHQVRREPAPADHSVGPEMREGPLDRVLISFDDGQHQRAARNDVERTRQAGEFRLRADKMLRHAHCPRRKQQKRNHGEPLRAPVPRAPWPESRRTRTGSTRISRSDPSPHIHGIAQNNAKRNAAIASHRPFQRNSGLRHHAARNHAPSAASEIQSSTGQYPCRIMPSESSLSSNP